MNNIHYIKFKDINGDIHRINLNHVISYKKRYLKRESSIIEYYYLLSFTTIIEHNHIIEMYMKNEKHANEIIEAIDRLLWDKSQLSDLTHL